MKKILVPMDGSESAKKACQVAKDLALKYDSDVILVTVVTRPAHGVRDGLMGYLDDILASKVEYTKKGCLK